jgi:hypothetical protein
MKVNCTSCGYEINLGHRGFEDYIGPVKCFCCGSMMEVKMIEGFVYSVNPLGIVQLHAGNNALENPKYISK